MNIKTIEEENNRSGEQELIKQNLDFLQLIAYHVDEIGLKWIKEENLRLLILLNNIKEDK